MCLSQRRPPTTCNVEHLIRDLVSRAEDIRARIKLLPDAFAFAVAQAELRVLDEVRARLDGMMR